MIREEKLILLMNVAGWLCGILFSILMLLPENGTLEKVFLVVAIILFILIVVTFFVGVATKRISVQALRQSNLTFDLIDIAVSVLLCVSCCLAGMIKLGVFFLLLGIVLRLDSIVHSKKSRER